MKDKIVLFRANSSSTIGTGHIMRDLVLASKYEKNGYTIVFVTQNLNGNINDKILSYNYKVEIVKDNTLKQFQRIIDKYKPKIIVIDSYDINYTFEKELKNQNQNIKLLCFDDTYEKHYCDILLNHNIYANKEKYKNLVNKNCKLKCGSKYTLLRYEFKIEKQKNRNKKYNFLIAMGGADTANLNTKILKVLLKMNKKCKIAVVTTNANKNIDKLKLFCKRFDNIDLKINSSKIAKLLNQTKLAIITPSVIANEISFLSTPFVAIKTASNQKYMYKYLKDNNHVVLKKFRKHKWKI